MRKGIALLFLSLIPFVFATIIAWIFPLTLLANLMGLLFCIAYGILVWAAYFFDKPYEKQKKMEAKT